MKEKRFTLVELIVSVIVISILASIVMVKILDIKNKSIGAAVSNNTKIIQTAVDRFILDNDGEYPIKNNLTVTLQKPQLIDVELLASKGYLKKDLDTTKVKKQHYWLDVFGVAWGSTESTVNDISSVTGKDGSTKLEFITPEGAIAYRIYEVIGYNKTGSITNKKDRHYKLVSEVELNKKRQKISFKIPDSSRTYLISAVDKYEQETVPVGVFYKGPVGFQPIFSGEGTYEFVIESYDEMFWVDFKTLEDKPGASTISYRFKVKDENGGYGEWVNNFKDLPSSNGITVQVEMKGDADGNKPSLYDLNVIYRYAYEEILLNPPPILTSPEGSTSICPTGYTKSTMSNGKWLVDQPKLATYLVDLDTGVSIDKVSTPYFMGYSIINVKYEYANGEGKYIVASGTYEITSGSCVNIIYTLEEDGSSPVKSDEPTKPNEPEGNQPGGPNQPGIPGIGNPIPPEVITCKDNCVSICEDCIPTCLENCLEYCDTNNCTEEENCKINECIDPPVCQEGDTGCTPAVCIEKCLDGPPTTSNPQDPLLTDPDWTTLESLRFFASGPSGVLTRWIGMVPDHEVEEGKTRVVYRYAKSNGYHWSGEIDEINKVGQSKSLMVIAYLQIHKDVKDDPQQIPAKVNSIQILHEKGAINLSSLQPSVAILPVKNNNEGRDVFSDETIFDWQYVAHDPKGRKITEIVWGGDKRDKYPIGTYTVTALVKSETELWSELTEYTFEVLPEKPIAKISMNISSGAKYIQIGDEVQWSAAHSSDPDGDKIVKIEWRGDKQIKYTKAGSYIVGLRVQDSEGHWSDWIEITFNVSLPSYKIYRIEAEDSNVKKAIHKTTSNSNFSNGTAVALNHSEGYHVTFEFTGNGFDIYMPVAYNIQLTLDEGTANEKTYQTGFYLSPKSFTIAGLEEGFHTAKLTRYAGNAATGYPTIDYIDVYSSNDNGTLKFNSSDVYSIDGSLQGAGGVTFNNSKGQSIRQYYTLHKDQYLKLEIVNSKNEVIRVLEEDSLKMGGTIKQHYTTWNGMDSKGDNVEDGSYKFKITSRGVNGTVNKYEREVFVHNPKPVYRIEAEDSNVKKVIYKTTSHSNFSNGTAVALNHSVGYHVTFEFTGNGFDIYMPVAYNIQLTLDEGTANEKIYQTGSHLSAKSFTVAGLEEGFHTAKLTRYAGNAATGYPTIDYMDVYSSSDNRSLEFKQSDVYASDNFMQGPGSNHFNNINGQYVKQYFQLTQNQHLTIQVLDSNNQVIKSLVQNSFYNGGSVNLHNVNWNGKNDAGENVGEGSYKIKITSKGVNGGIEKTYTSEFYIDRRTYSSRIEAESPSVSKNIYSTLSNSAYSGGKAVRLHHLVGYYVTFAFEGNGFDVYMPVAYNIQAVLDAGTPNEKVYRTGSYLNGKTFTIRGLENGFHTLTLTRYDGNASTGYPTIDYLNVYQ